MAATVASLFLVPPWPRAAAGALLGLVAGSFLATLIRRWGEGRSVARGRSACDDCGQALAAVELVPLVSFAALGGRCRRCRAPIDPLHPAVEAGAAAIGLVALLAEPGWGGLAGALFGWGLLALALLDLRHLWLPDALTLPLLLAGLAGGLAGLPPAPLDRAIGAAAGWGGLAAVAFLYRRWRGRTGIGGGDPKLFGAIGAWLGWAVLPQVLLGACLTGLAIVAALALAGRPVGRTTRLPFGALLAPAAWALWLIG